MLRDDMACFVCELRGLTDRVIEYRNYLEGNMALELKGLRGKALKAAGHLDRLNAAYDAFNEAAPAHAADVEGLTPQITALQDDLAFATQILGNSVNGSGGQQEGQTPPAVKPPELPKTESTVTPEPHKPTLSDRVSGSMMPPPRV